MSLRKRITTYIIILFMTLSVVSVSVPALTVHAVTIKAEISAGTTYLRVRTSPGGDIMSDSSGNTIYLHGGHDVVIKDKSNSAWYKVKFKYNGESYTGYVSSQYVTEKSDDDGGGGSEVIVPDVPTSDVDFESSISQFPESYRPYLRHIHEMYPYWQFKPVNTGISWDTLVDNEINKSGQVKSLIYCTSYAPHYNWRSTSVGYNYKTDTWSYYDGPYWFAASDALVKYYLDPRTYLYEDYIFVFESLSYQAGMQNESGVEAILAGSFMSHACPEGSPYTYAQIIMSAAQQSGVSPYHIASRIRLEMGAEGGICSFGNSSSYPGIYNFYNIGAFDSADGSAAVSGLSWAASEGSYGRPWNSAAKSIVGGAQFLGASYINVGQDTLYTQKFNVTNTDSLFWHQYMSAVQAPAVECLTNYEAYRDNNLLGSTMVFKIPVYTDMPDQAVSKPSDSGNPNNWLAELNVSGYSLTPSFAVNKTTKYSLIVPESLEQITVSAKPVNGNASVKGTGTIKIKKGTNVISITVTAQSGSTRVYKLSVVRGNAGDGTNIIDDGGGSSASGIKGDLNGDGNISAVDIVKVQRLIVGLDALTDDALARGDINGDGKISAIDVVKLQRHIVGLELIQ